ncbi:MAG: universal stress protein [Armatimonadota bacterium]
MMIQKILVPTDGSESSIRAARYAAEIASCVKATVVILNAAEISGITQFVTYSVLATGNLNHEMREAGESAVDRTKQPFLEADVPVRSKILEGFASEVILTEAQEGEYDLIVMGSRGAGAGLVRRVVFGLGSVAERVVASAPCPVLVVRD